MPRRCVRAARRRTRSPRSVSRASMTRPGHGVFRCCCSLPVPDDLTDPGWRPHQHQPRLAQPPRRRPRLAQPRGDRVGWVGAPARPAMCGRARRRAGGESRRVVLRMPTEFGGAEVVEILDDSTVVDVVQGATLREATARRSRRSVQRRSSWTGSLRSARLNPSMPAATMLQCSAGPTCLSISCCAAPVGSAGTKRQQRWVRIMETFVSVSDHGTSRLRASAIS
jgi:hypothetical protein